MDAFRQPVHYYEDGVVPFGLWQLSNSVNGDDLPMAAWDLVGHKLPHLLCWEGFAAVAGIAPCHVAGNIAGDAQPPVIAGPAPVSSTTLGGWSSQSHGGHGQCHGRAGGLL